MAFYSACSSSDEPAYSTIYFIKNISDKKQSRTHEFGSFMGLHVCTSFSNSRKKNTKYNFIVKSVKKEKKKKN